MNLAEELKSGGVYPTGPVSAWPQERNEQLAAAASRAPQIKDPEIRTSAGQMAKGFMKVAAQAVRNGKVSPEIREERYDMCKACPAFRPGDKRCSECGCFMEAKTCIAGDPKNLCPLKKWKR